MKKLITCILILTMALALAGCASGDYKEAQALFDKGEYEAASRIYSSLADYKDSAEKLKECRYQQGCAALEQGDYERAVLLFQQLGEYQDSQNKVLESQYREAVELFDEGEYEVAQWRFEALGDYEDSADRLSRCRSELALAALEGTWTGTVDAVQYIVAGTPEMADYLKTAPIAITLELTTDGEYTLTSDGTTMLPDFKAAMRSYMTDLCKEEGITVADLEAQLQMTLDEFIDGLFNQMDLSVLNESVSGAFNAGDGTITFDPGQARQVEGTWSGDTMSFTIDIGDVTLTRK